MVKNCTQYQLVLIFKLLINQIILNIYEFKLLFIKLLNSIHKINALTNYSIATRYIN